MQSLLLEVLGSVFGTLIANRLEAYARRPRETTRGNNTMPYDIIGDDDDVVLGDDDEIHGAIGADLDLILGDDDDVSGLLDDLDVGADEDLLEALAVSGAGGSEIIGAGPGRVSVAQQKAARALRDKASQVKKAAGKVKKAALKQAVLRRVVNQGGSAIVQRSLDRKRRYPLGFTVTTITPTTTLLVPAAPQNMFRAERLMVPSDIAYDLGIVDVKVGNQSQLVQSVEVPAAAFVENAVGTLVMFDTAEIGNQISIQVRNKDTVNAVVFTGAVFGTIAK